jgi:branched-chain amino acid transport system permease protein
MTARLALFLLTAAIVAAVGRLSEYLPDYFQTQLIYIGINIILAVSLNLINGFAGQFSLGHAGFMAIGAYVTAYLTVNYGGFSSSGAVTLVEHVGLPHLIAVPLVFLAATLMGGLVAAFFGVLVGLPTLRLRGDYLAIATLGFGEIIVYIISQIEEVGGARGFSLSSELQLSSFFWVYAWVALTILAARNLITSSHGRALVAIREDEVAAAAMGIDTTRYKVIAFVIGASLAGVAGALYGHYSMYLHIDSFRFLRSIEIVVMVVVGGMGSIAGSVAAAVILTLLPELLRSFLGVASAAYILLMGAAVLSLRGTGNRLAHCLAISSFAMSVLLGAAALMTKADIGEALAAAPPFLPWVCAAAGLLGASGVIMLKPRTRATVSRSLLCLLSTAAMLILLLHPQLLPEPVLQVRAWVNAKLPQLRMVIYALLLVALMLSRPAGLFGGQELSWQSFRGLLGKTPPQPQEQQGAAS